jgi:hypothetical protein
VNIATFLHESSRGFGARPAVTRRNETLNSGNVSDRAAKFSQSLGLAAVGGSTPLRESDHWRQQTVQGEILASYVDFAATQSRTNSERA